MTALSRSHPRRGRAALYAHGPDWHFLYLAETTSCSRCVARLARLRPRLIACNAHSTLTVRKA